MINPPKSKQYFLTLEEKSRKDSLKYEKDWHYQEKKVDDLKRKLDDKKLQEKNEENIANTNEREAVGFAASSAALFIEADRLSSSGSPTDHSRALRLRIEATALAASAAAKRSDASRHKSRANQLRFDVNFMYKDIQYNEKLGQDFLFKMKQALKQADIYKGQAYATN